MGLAGGSQQNAAPSHPNHQGFDSAIPSSQASIEQLSKLIRTVNGPEQQQHNTSSQMHHHHQNQQQPITMYADTRYERTSDGAAGAENRGSVGSRQSGY